MIQELPSEHFTRVEELYTKTGKTFPVILSVIRGLQRGRIFVDRQDQPGSALVLHKFGFACAIGNDNDTTFNQAAVELLAQTGIVNREYMLLYWPGEPLKTVLSAAKPTNFRLRRRARLVRSPGAPFAEFDERACTPLTPDVLMRAGYLAAEIDTRFWDSAQHFQSNGFGMAVMREDKPISVCYSAALVDNKAEIDIVTAEQDRGKGFGQKALSAFLTAADARGVITLWDCFEANEASLRLARRNGFTEVAQYEFATFNTPLHV